MDFKKTYWEVVETKDDLSQLREQASSNTIKELAILYAVSYLCYGCSSSHRYGGCAHTDAFCHVA